MWRQAVLALCAALWVAAPSGAQVSACETAYQKNDAEARIRLYTMCIERGGLSADARAAAYHDRAVAYAAAGQRELALADYDQALALDPDMGIAHYNRSLVHQRRGDLIRAMSDLDQAVRLMPTDGRGRAHIQRARIALDSGQVPEAIWDLEQAVELDRRDAVSRRMLAWVFATSPDPTFRNAGRAVELAERAMRLDRSAWQTHDALAAAYAEAGMFPEAVEEEQRAIKLQTDDGKRPPDPTLTARLALYQGGRPYREAGLVQPPR